MEKLISIIVPVYNVQQYLPQCIDSLICQTYQNIEIIAVNDGSTDDSLSILKALKKKDNRIIIVDQANKGISEARNIGIQNSFGEYIMFVDSDDWIDDITCEVAITALERYDCDLVFWDYVRERGKNSQVKNMFDNAFFFDLSSEFNLRRRIVGLYRNELHQPDHMDACVTVWGKLYKRSLISRIVFVDTKEIGSEDTLFNIQALAYLKKGYYINKAMYHYRRGVASTFTSTFKTDHYDRWIVLFRRINDIIISEKLDKSFSEALNNRITMSVFYLGLSVASSDLSFGEKVRYISRIINSEQYSRAVKSFDFYYLPILWRPFIFSAKYRMSKTFCVLVELIQFLRKIRNT